MRSTGAIPATASAIDHQWAFPLFRRIALSSGVALMFRRRPRLVAFALLVLILSGAIGALIAMLKREPAFYAQAAPRSDYDTREKASRCLTRMQDLKNDIRTKRE